MESALNAPAPTGTNTPPPQNTAPVQPSNPTAPQTINSEPPNATWRDTLPDDIKNAPDLLAINDVPTLVKNYINTKKMVGFDKIPVPSKHSTDDDWQQVYDKLGRPKVEEYKVNLPKDSKFIDENFMKELTPLAHKAGILPKQLEPVLSWYEQTIAKAEQTIAQEKEKNIKDGLDSLKKEYGVAYDQKLSYAHQLLKDHATPELLKLVDEDKALGNNPGLIKMLSKVGEMLYKEDGMPDAGQSSGGKFTPDEARMRANSILADTTHPYSNSEHPNHAAAVKEVQGLWEMAYPTQEKS